MKLSWSQIGFVFAFSEITNELGLTEKLEEFPPF
jgi:hypothetical protein